MQISSSAPLGFDGGYILQISLMQTRSFSYVSFCSQPELKAWWQGNGLNKFFCLYGIHCSWRAKWKQNVWGLFSGNENKGQRWRLFPCAWPTEGAGQSTNKAMTREQQILYGCEVEDSSAILVTAFFALSCSTTCRLRVWGLQSFRVPVRGNGPSRNIRRRVHSQRNYWISWSILPSIYFQRIDLSPSQIFVQVTEHCYGMERQVFFHCTGLSSIACTTVSKFCVPAWCQGPWKYAFSAGTSVKHCADYLRLHRTSLYYFVQEFRRQQVPLISESSMPGICAPRC